jgi:phenylacetate-CoA ligase
MPIQEAQIIQESVRQLRVRLVPTAAYTEQAGATLVKRMREHVGDMEIVVEPVAQIERTTNGKFRAVVSKLKVADGN